MNARYSPSVVKTGWLSTNRPSVTSTTDRSSTRASLIRASGCGPGCAQASQAESGDQETSSISPSSLRASSVVSPDSTSMRSSRPSAAVAASLVPSGDDARSSTLPRSPAAMVRTDPACSASITAPWMASAPSASVTQATEPVRPSTRGSRARAAGSTSSARAGPSSWVSQCTVPRTVTTLAWPVRSQSRSPRWSSAVISLRARAVGGVVSWMSSLRGLVSGSRLSSVQMSPATWYTTRVPSVAGLRA